MKELAIALGLILTFVFGSLCGYAIAVEQVHKEAVAAGTGRWMISSPRDVQFAWVVSPD